MNERFDSASRLRRCATLALVAIALIATSCASILVAMLPAGASYSDSPYTGPGFCTKYGAAVGPQIVIAGVKTNIYECGGNPSDPGGTASPYTNQSTPFDDNGSGTDPFGSFQCVELSLRFEYVVYKKNTLYNVTGKNLPNGAGANVVEYLHSQFGVPVGFGTSGRIGVPPSSAPAPVPGNILSLGPPRADEPKGHTAVIENVTGSPSSGNYVVTIVSENAPTISTIRVVHGHWATHWGYSEYNWTRQSGGANGAPVLGITTPSTNTSPPNASVGSPYSFQLSASGVPGPYVWSLVNGSLPPGLSLSSSGLISGTPTTVSEGGPFTVRVVAGSQNDEGVFTIWALRIKPTTPVSSSSCWGRCGGPEGPVGGYFGVSGKSVQDFQDTQVCLGSTSSGFAYYLEIDHALPIASNAFSYSGPASVWDGSGKSGTNVWVTLAGKFTSTTQAAVTLEIIWKQCGTYHLTIHALRS